MFAESLKVIFLKILSFISTLAGVIVILVIGWFIARVIKELIARLLKAIHFEEISKRRWKQVSTLVTM